MAEMTRRKKQFLVFGLGAAGVLAVLVIVSELSQPGQIAEFAAPTSAVDTTLISDRTAAASPEMSWITQSRNELERIARQMAEANRVAEADRAAFARALEAVRRDYDRIIEQLIGKVAELEEGRAEAGLAPTAAAAPAPAGSPGGADFLSPRRPGRAAPAEPAAMPAVGAPAFVTAFALADRPVAEDDSEVTVYTLGDYVPAGSYMRAVVLSGADAATNVGSREDPIPVLFRITGPAVTAGYAARGGASVDLTGCTVIGSATGDLSSERVKVRLISMTCLNYNGTVLEVPVEGYMAGDGKAGVRGAVVSREGDLVRNAAIAGALEGLGSGISAAGSAVLGTDRNNAGQVLNATGAGMIGGGLGEAASALSAYYIDRAEQYQPVVSLYGGTRVELVFIRGVRLG
jgi:conjugal transfer pilus assembly protein TraB